MTYTPPGWLLLSRGSIKGSSMQWCCRCCILAPCLQRCGLICLGCPALPAAKVCLLPAQCATPSVVCLVIHSGLLDFCPSCVASLHSSEPSLHEHFGASKGFAMSGTWDRNSWQGTASVCCSGVEHCSVVLWLWLGLHHLSLCVISTCLGPLPPSVV
jgi:hypothetical protein